MKLSDEACKKVRAGDLSNQRDILTTQAMALDAVFTLMVTRSENSLKDYFGAGERFMRLAMKAQTQCRTIIEALGPLGKGRGTSHQYSFWPARVKEIPSGYLGN